MGNLWHQCCDILKAKIVTLVFYSSGTMGGPICPGDPHCSPSLPHLISSQFISTIFVLQKLSGQNASSKWALTKVRSVGLGLHFVSTVLPSRDWTMIAADLMATLLANFIISTRSATVSTSDVIVSTMEFPRFQPLVKHVHTQAYTSKEPRKRYLRLQTQNRFLLYQHKLVGKPLNNHILVIMGL